MSIFVLNCGRFRSNLDSASVQLVIVEQLGRFDRLRSLEDNRSLRPGDCRAINPNGGL